jgi:beta-glucosidase
VESGEFDILVGKSSRDIVSKKTIVVESTVKLPQVYTASSSFSDVMEDPAAMKECQPLWDAVASLFEAESPSDGGDPAQKAIIEQMTVNMIKVMPLRAAINFGDGSVDYEQLNAILDKINKR